MSKKVVTNVHKPLIFAPVQTESTPSTVNEQFKTQVIDESIKQFRSTLYDKIGEEHPFDYILIENLCKKFGLVNAILDKITDFTLGPGYYIESEDEELVEFLEEWREKTKIDFFLKPWFKEGLQKGAGYLEVAGLSDPKKENTVKVVNSNSIYAKRDKFGTIIAYNQLLRDLSAIGIALQKDDINPLTMDDIIQLNVNKLGSSAYGQGVVFAALDTVNDFLLAQKSMHKLIKRKANTPFHWKLGDSEKEDYPSQEDIDAFAGKLTFMNESTEYVTGPNAEAKVIDFGNIGEKFASILENDYQLLSYIFQVPEPILGKGNVAEGLGNVQMDGFLERCRSYQQDITITLINKVYNKVLENAGYDDYDYKICFYPSEGERTKLMDSYARLLSITNISAGMKIQLEKKIADEFGIDYEQVQVDNDLAKKEQEKMMKAQQSQPFKKKDEESIDQLDVNESVSRFIEKLPDCSKGRYKHFHSYMNNEKFNEDFTIQEWITKDYSSYKDAIIEVIKNDNFDDLRAETKTEEKAGYLNEKKIDKLREVLIDGFEKNLGLNKLIDNIQKEVKIRNLYEYNRKGLVKDDKGNKIKLLDSDNRSKMIARTEVVRVASEGFADDLKKHNQTLFKWITEEDARVCPQCAPLDGQIFELADSDNFPPLHANCRCQMEEVATESVQTILKLSVEADLAPQETELRLMNECKIDETKAKKLVESFYKLKAEEFVRKVGDEYCVFSHRTGKNFGCYKTKGEAEKRLAQMHAFSK